LTTGNFTQSTANKTTANKSYIILDGQEGIFSFTDLTFSDQYNNSITGFTSPYLPTSNITIDTILPVISFIDDASAVGVGSDTININVTDTNPKTSTYEYGFSSDIVCDINDTFGNIFTSGTAFTIDTETNNGKYICVKAEDMAGNISYLNSTSVLGINNAPTDISISSVVLDENTVANTVIGTLSNADVSSGNTYRYTLIAGVNDTDNGLFSITGTDLKINSSLDYETKSSYKIRVNVNDGVNDFAKQFTINITDLNDNAPVITSGMAAVAIIEDSGAGQNVYTATSTDADETGELAIYGLSGTDAALFTIDAVTGVVTLVANPDFETKSSYNFNITVTDGTNVGTLRLVTLNITDLDGNATVIKKTTTTSTRS
jgi:hypothetical protein